MTDQDKKAPPKDPTDAERRDGDRRTVDDQPYTGQERRKHDRRST